MANKSNPIRNWHDYNKALVSRGSLTVWFDKKSCQAWHDVNQTGQPGRPARYSDFAIQCALTIKMIYHLTLRSTQGLLDSIITMLDLDLESPHFSTLSRRQRHLKINIHCRKPSKEPIHLLVDASGLKVYGEGEWKVRMHGIGKRRQWKKLHIAIDAQTQDILSTHMTESKAHDAPIFPVLIDELPAAVQVHSISGDGAYDSRKCYEKSFDIGAKPLFPPKVTAAYKIPAKDRVDRARNFTLMSISCRGKSWWNEQTHYHRRSLVETAFFRIKQLLGRKLSSRTYLNQRTECLLKCFTINKINLLSMPVR